jgi:hypothetical protein
MRGIMTDTARTLNSGEVEVSSPHSANTRSSVNGVKPMLMIATAALCGGRWIIISSSRSGARVLPPGDDAAHRTLQREETTWRRVKVKARSKTSSGVAPARSSNVSRRRTNMFVLHLSHLAVDCN